MENWKGHTAQKDCLSQGGKSGPLTTTHSNKFLWLFGLTRVAISKRRNPKLKKGAAIHATLRGPTSKPKKCLMDTISWPLLDPQKDHSNPKNTLICFTPSSRPKKIGSAHLDHWCIESSCPVAAFKYSRPCHTYEMEDLGRWIAKSKVRMLYEQICKEISVTIRNNGDCLPFFLGQLRK